MYKGTIDPAEFRILVWSAIHDGGKTDLELLGELEDLVRRARLGTNQEAVKEAAIRPLTWKDAESQFKSKPRLRFDDDPTANETTLVMPKITDDEPESFAPTSQRLPFESDRENVGLDILESREQLDEEPLGSPSELY